MIKIVHGLNDDELKRQPVVAGNINTNSPRQLATNAEVEAGGHFFGATHTLARYETTFYQPLVSDWHNFETWSEDGALTAT